MKKLIVTIAALLAAAALFQAGRHEGIRHAIEDSIISRWNATIQKIRTRTAEKTEQTRPFISILTGIFTSTECIKDKEKTGGKKQ